MVELTAKDSKYNRNRDHLVARADERHNHQLAQRKRYVLERMRPRTPQEAHFR